MKNKITTLKTKSKKFVGDNKEVILVLTGYVIGATVAFAAMADAKNRAWDKAELNNLDRPENSFLVQQRDGRIGYVVPPEEDN